MYRVGDQEFALFSVAVRYARETVQSVYEVATGTQRWAPAGPPSKAAVRAYRERCAAYAAQERLAAMRERHDAYESCLDDCHYCLVERHQRGTCGSDCRHFDHDYDGPLR
jgi:hypothetical protein